MLVIPPTLRRNVLDVWGEAGSSWLDRLPALLDEVLEQWSLHVGDPFAMTFHWVTRVVLDDGTPGVLKLGVPGSDHQAVEAATLTAWAGRGAVTLLAHDVERGALLLRGAIPGSALRALVPADDEDATAIAAEVANRLHAASVPVAGVPRLSDARRALVRYLAVHAADGPLPRRLVVRAAGLFDDLVASAPASVLLHGDLHHDNVLRDADGWVAIDPNGWIGDPGFELGPLLYNPDPAFRSAELLALVPARLEQLADALALSPERGRAWGFVAAVLSEVWSTEDVTAYAPGRALDVALQLERAAGRL